MRVALCVFMVSTDIEQNKARVLKNILEAKTEGADLIVFPEACITGLVNIGDPMDDLKYGMPAEDKFLSEVSQLANGLSMAVSLGFLEKTREGVMYGSLLFVDGKAKASYSYLYRRIDPGWRTRRCDPNVYRVGNTVILAATEFGTFSFLICGDLFNDKIISRLKDGKPFNYLIHPFTPMFSSNSSTVYR